MYPVFQPTTPAALRVSSLNASLSAFNNVNPFDTRGVEANGVTLDLLNNRAQSEQKETIAQRRRDYELYLDTQRVLQRDDNTQHAQVDEWTFDEIRERYNEIKRLYDQDVLGIESRDLHRLMRQLAMADQVRYNRDQASVFDRAGIAIYSTISNAIPDISAYGRFILASMPSLPSLEIATGVASWQITQHIGQELQSSRVLTPAIELLCQQAPTWISFHTSFSGVDLDTLGDTRKNALHGMCFIGLEIAREMMQTAYDLNVAMTQSDEGEIVINNRNNAIGNNAIGNNAIDSDDLKLNVQRMALNGTKHEDIAEYVRSHLTVEHASMTIDLGGVNEQRFNTTVGDLLRRMDRIEQQPLAFPTSIATEQVLTTAQRFEDMSKDNRDSSAPLVSAMAFILNYLYTAGGGLVNTAMFPIQTIADLVSFLTVSWTSNLPIIAAALFVVLDDRPQTLESFPVNANGVVAQDPSHIIRHPGGGSAPSVFKNILAGGVNVLALRFIDTLTNYALYSFTAQYDAYYLTLLAAFLTAGPPLYATLLTSRGRTNIISAAELVQKMIKQSRKHLRVVYKSLMDVTGRPISARSSLSGSKTYVSSGDEQASALVLFVLLSLAV